MTLDFFLVSCLQMVGMRMMMMMKYHGVESQGKVHGIINAPWPTLFCTTVQGKIPGALYVYMIFVAIPTCT